MLIDWPSHKLALGAEIREVLRRQSHSGIVAHVPAIILNEGNLVVILHPDGHRQEMPLRTAEVTAVMTRAELMASGPEVAAKAIRELGRGLGDQMSKSLIDVMKKSSPRHGGMFGGKNDEEMFNQLMDGLKEMDVGFDDDGKPTIFFVTHPDNAHKFQALNTPERQKAFDKLIEEKRIEWLRRESYRRLAD